MNSFAPPGLLNPTPKTPEIPVYERKDFNHLIAGWFVLAACAGFVNICSIYIITITVNHNTGIFSRMSHNYALMDFSIEIFCSCIILGFLWGSASVGFFIQKEKFYLSRKYGLFFNQKLFYYSSQFNYTREMNTLNLWLFRLLQWASKMACSQISLEL